MRKHRRAGIKEVLYYHKREIRVISDIHEFSLCLCALHYFSVCFAKSGITTKDEKEFFGH